MDWYVLCWSHSGEGLALLEVRWWGGVGLGGWAVVCVCVRVCDVAIILLAALEYYLVYREVCARVYVCVCARACCRVYGVLCV